VVGMGISGSGSVGVSVPPHAATKANAASTCGVADRVTPRGIRQRSEAGISRCYGAGKAGASG
jgi:hypothetical protein